MFLNRFCAALLAERVKKEEGEEGEEGEEDSAVKIIYGIEEGEGETDDGGEEERTGEEEEEEDEEAKDEEETKEGDGEMLEKSVDRVTTAGLKGGNSFDQIVSEENEVGKNLPMI